MNESKIENGTSESLQPNIYRYYNLGGIGLGVAVVSTDNIKHQDGDHTFLTGRQPQYQWIMSVDLYDTYEEAKNAPVARFYNGK